MPQQAGVYWPTCEQEGCIGIRLDSARMCLAHCSDDERAAALKLIGETGVVDVRGVPITPALLDQALTAAPRGADREPLIKGCRFDKATFNGDADFGKLAFSGRAAFGGTTFNGDAEFRGAVFSGEADFLKAVFNGSADFREAVFGGDAWFSDVAFKSGANFNKAAFSGRAAFGQTAFNGDAEFRRAVFSGDAALFPKAAFGGDAWFGGTTFSSQAWFGGAAFSGSAAFGGTAFNGDAEFRGAVFSGGADFAEALFSGRAGFGTGAFSGYVGFDEAMAITTGAGDAASFSGYVGFDEAAFNSNAEFNEVIFRGHSGFRRAVFSGEAQFAGTIFGDDARFSGARFEHARHFGPMLAYRGLNLDNAWFAQAVQIEVSTAELSCRRARFPGGVQFRLRWASVVLDDTDLAAPSILTGSPHPPKSETLGKEEEFARLEEQMASSWRQELAGEIFERPQLMSLRRANVAGLGLSNISAADCQFAGAHNLDKLRLESDVSFAAAPLPVGLDRQKWGGRQVIAEERAWRTGQAWRTAPTSSSDPGAKRRRWVSPWWALGGDPPGVLTPGQIAGVYRALRKAREDAKDEPGAADFYYGEMEMRRRARPLSASNPDARPSTMSRGWVERVILTAYWLVSGYGLRAWRAVACLAAVTALLALAFHLWGFTAPPYPDSYWTSLLYSFRATLSLTDSDVKLTAWGQLLQGVLRLTGPVLLGLALLALRGRVKR